MTAEFLSRLQGSTFGWACSRETRSAGLLAGHTPNSSELKTLSEQVRHLDEEGAAVATKSWFQRSAEAIETIAAQIVVVTDVKSSTGIRRVTEQELSLHARFKGCIVDT